MYDQMITTRYGLTPCCDEDAQKWEIKKALLDLNAIYDPELCKCVIPPKCCPPSHVQAFIIPPYIPPVGNCVCWSIDVEVGFILIEYINCDGETVQRGVPVDSEIHICSQSDVTAIQVNPGSVYTMQQSQFPCVEDDDCDSPPSDCTCYQTVVTQGLISITWVGCDFTIHVLEVKPGDTVVSCCSVAPSIVSEDPGSVYTIEPLVGECSTNADCNDIACLPPSNVQANITAPVDTCKCYQMNVLTEGCSITINDCDTGMEINYPGLVKGLYFLCSDKTPTSNCFNTNVKDLGICESGFCVPNKSCADGECCCFEIQASKGGDIMYIDCNGLPKILTVVTGLNKVCAQALYYGPFGGIISASSVGPCDETCVII
jgi:hypothetical protein